MCFHAFALRVALACQIVRRARVGVSRLLTAARVADRRLIHKIGAGRETAKGLFTPVLASAQIQLRSLLPTTDAENV